MINEGLLQNVKMTKFRALLQFKATDMPETVVFLGKSETNKARSVLWRNHSGDGHWNNGRWSAL